MLRIKNTALDRTKTLLHRTTPKLEMEPVICGQRLRLNTSVDVTEEWAHEHRENLERLVGQGVIEICYSDAAPVEPKLNEAGLKLGGPTFEEFTRRGYPADKYPPEGWAEVPSAGLTAYRSGLKADAAAAEAKAKEEAELAAMIAAEEEAAKAAVEAAKKLELSDTPVVSDVLTATTELAGAPVAVVPPAPPAAPAVEEKKDEGKKGPGKSKLK